MKKKELFMVHTDDIYLIGYQKSGRNTKNVLCNI